MAREGEKLSELYVYTCMSCGTEGVIQTSVSEIDIVWGGVFRSQKCKELNQQSQQPIAGHAQIGKSLSQHENFENLTRWNWESIQH